MVVLSDFRYEYPFLSKKSKSYDNEGRASKFARIKKYGQNKGSNPLTTFLRKSNLRISSSVLDILKI